MFNLQLVKSVFRPQKLKHQQDKKNSQNKDLSLILAT